MKFNIAYPASGCQKIVEVDDEKKLQAFYDKRISQEVDGGVLGEQYEGYIFKITGGMDQQGFPMLQGVLLPHRTKLLLDARHKGFKPKRKGQRRRRSVRGCIVGPDLSVLSLTIVKKGKEDLPGLTDALIPRRLGPKRASKIRKLFNLSKNDDVRRYVIRRKIERGEGKSTKTKAPRIQRLVTPAVIHMRRRKKIVVRKRKEKAKEAKDAYRVLLAKKKQAAKEKREALISKKRSMKASTSTKKKTSTKAKAEPAKKAPAKKAPAKKAAKGGKKGGKK